MIGNIETGQYFDFNDAPGVIDLISRALFTKSIQKVQTIQGYVNEN